LPPPKVVRRMIHVLVVQWLSVGLGVLVKCGIAECGMLKVKCGIENCGNGCGTVGKMWNAERVYRESKATQLTCGSPGHEYGV